MAKQSYKIPESLDKTFMEARIPLSKSTSMIKPVPIALVLAWVGAILMLMLCIAQTFIGQAGIPLIITFSALWLLLAFIMLIRDNKLNRPQAGMLPAAFNYLPNAARRIQTRRASKANAFSGLTNIKNINEHTGVIEFWDGDYGYMYRVVGTASVLLFEDDRESILDRCDTFFRKMRTDCEMIFITVKEPQKVYRQLAAIHDRYERLDVNDPDLLALADSQFKCLKNEVGETYRSIHQYLIIKAKNREELNLARSTMQIECESSQMMFKQHMQLKANDIYDVLATIYQGKESV